MALNDGSMFGKEGDGFMRLNVAAPRSVIEQILSRIENAVKQINISAGADEKNN